MAAENVTWRESEPDRRGFERTPVAIFGRCLLPNKLEIPCQAINLSPGDAAFVVAHPPRIDDHIIVYLDHVGRLEGLVTRLFEGGFAMRLEGTARKREKIAATLEWLKNTDPFDPRDSRRHERLEPQNSNSMLELEDGRTYPIQIIDISLSGAAFATDVRPAIGSRVSLCGMKGSIVRHFPEGVAMEFYSVQQRSGLSGILDS
ncbi:MAG: PilZ domain-containing protein [Pseudomonadota bacterium]